MAVQTEFNGFDWVNNAFIDNINELVFHMEYFETILIGKILFQWTNKDIEMAFCFDEVRWYKFMSYKVVNSVESIISITVCKYRVIPYYYIDNDVFDELARLRSYRGICRLQFSRNIINEITLNQCLCLLSLCSNFSNMTSLTFLYI